MPFDYEFFDESDLEDDEDYEYEFIEYIEQDFWNEMADMYDEAIDYVESGGS